MIASTLSIPAQESSDGDGGEWELLVGKVKDWLEENDLAELWTCLLYTSDAADE